MATIYAKNKQTGEWERVGPAANATDSTLTLAGSPADAKATGEAIDNIQIRIENLTAEDVGALPSSTEIPSIEGLASEEYVNIAATNAANAVKNDLLDGAGEAYDTLKELGTLIDENTNALEALGILASVSEVEVSDTAPTDENVEIWVNTAEEPVGVAIYGTRADSTQADLSQTDSTQPDYVNGVIRKESLPEGYPYKEQSEVVIEWDGNTEGRATITGKNFKVTDIALSGLAGNKVVMYNNGTFKEYTITGETAEGDLHYYSITLDEGAYAGESLTVLWSIPAGNAYDLEDGTYFYWENENVYLNKVSAVTETIHTMAPEFLPFYTVTVDPATNMADYTGAQIAAMAECGWVTMRLVYQGQDQGARYIYAGSRNNQDAMFVNICYRDLYGLLIQYRAVAWEDKTTTGGQMYRASAVADAAGDTPTAAEFNALLATLRSAGLLASS